MSNVFSLMWIWQRTASAGGVLCPRASCRGVVRIGFHPFDGSGDHDRGGSVSALALPLCPDLLELGGGHGVLFREFCQSERRAAESALGTGGSSDLAPHRSDDRGDQ